MQAIIVNGPAVPAPIGSGISTTTAGGPADEVADLAMKHAGMLTRWRALFFAAGWPLNKFRIRNVAFPLKNLREEHFGPLVLRVREDLQGVTRFNHDATVHEDK